MESHKIIQVDEKVPFNLLIPLKRVIIIYVLRVITMR